MKKLKKGFSLAELLIALAIISIIAIMGLNITKKSAEKAYNLYIYTGYSAIQNAIADATSKGYKFYPDCPIDITNNTCKIIDHIEKVLKAENITSTSYTNKREFKTQNGIIYTFELTGSGTSRPYDCKIYMTYPVVKYRKNNIVYSHRVVITYLHQNTHSDGGYPVLLPESEIDTDLPLEQTLLQDRVDLLPFYLDNGKNGKILTDYNENNNTLKPRMDKYERLNFLSFRQAFCKQYDTRTMNPKINCNGYAKEEEAVIRVANPRKVF